ncbi:hypothetical protein MMC13_006357 [Lambiella insularis]|nr:hypothetical protein [Lambiella insularis]
MQESTAKRSAHNDDAVEALNSLVAGTTLAEVNGNGVSTGLKDNTNTGKEVHWGGENQQPVSDDETQKPELGDQTVEDLIEALSAKKTKKKRKSSKKGLSAPSGFEEYYVDVPVTPEQFEEEKSIYDASITFSERIETAIQRYVARRKFDSVRKDLFDKYMSFGGIDSGPKMFGGGLDSQTLEESTAADIAKLTATNYVGNEQVDPRSKDYVVDFDGVLKGFLSSRLPQVFDLVEEQQIKGHIAVIRNFLNYLLHHEVCPEYKDQINAARDTCNLGEKQLWSITQACRILPGHFNQACSVLFGGYHQRQYIGDQEWVQSLDVDKGMSIEQARKIFLAGLAAQGDDEVFRKYNKHVSKNKAHALEKVETGLEVIEIEYADEEIRKYYAAADNPAKGLSPLGTMKVKTWKNTDDAPEDLTEEEEQELADGNNSQGQIYTLWIEDNVLSKLFVGMKLEAKIYKLSFGIWFLDLVTGAFCSFFDVLPNEKMIGWREHKYLPRREVQKRPDLVLTTHPEDEGADEPRALPQDAEDYEQGEDIVVRE